MKRNLVLTPTTLPPEKDAGALVAKYLTYVRTEKRLASRTVELYTLDLEKLSSFADRAQVDLLQVRNHHIRRWVAQIKRRLENRKNHGNKDYQSNTS